MLPRIAPSTDSPNVTSKTISPNLPSHWPAVASARAP